MKWKLEFESTPSAELIETLMAHTRNIVSEVRDHGVTMEPSIAVIFRAGDSFVISVSYWGIDRDAQASLICGNDGAPMSHIQITAKAAPKKEVIPY